MGELLRFVNEKMAPVGPSWIRKIGGGCVALVDFCSGLSVF